MHQISRLQMAALEDAAEQFFRQRVARAMSELSAEELKRQGVAPEKVAAFTDKALDQGMRWPSKQRRRRPRQVESDVAPSASPCLGAVR
jgi:hypothetical protein